VVRHYKQITDLYIPKKEMTSFEDWLFYQKSELPNLNSSQLVESKPASKKGHLFLG